MWTYVVSLFLYFVFKRARSEIVVFFVQYETLKEITVRVFSQGNDGQFAKQSRF